MSNLFFLIGAPGSGKSTFAKQYVETNGKYVSRDEIRFSLVPETEEYFSKEKEVLKTFIAEINEGLLNKWYDYVIADATNLTIAARAKILRNLKTKPNHIYAFYFDVPLDVALYRNSLRRGRQFVPERAIENMYNSIELPTLDEGFDGLYFIDKNGIIDWENRII